MTYLEQYRKIRPFVKSKIPHNKKLFTKSEKSFITRYYNKLETMGYLNREREGYINKNISRTKYKIKNSPAIKLVPVNVGTNVINGKVETDTSAKIKIKNGKIYVRRRGMPYRWEFEYNIKKDWNKKDFIKHLKNQMLPNKVEKGQIFVVGAGMYEMTTGADNLEDMASDILRMANKYTMQVIEGDRPDYQAPENFMYRVVVYENIEAFKLRSKNVKKRKRLTKRQRIRMK